MGILGPVGYWMCACLAVLAGGWIVFVVGLLSAMGWAGSLGQKADLTGQIVIVGIGTAAVAFSTVPALYVVQHLRGKPVPRLVEVLGWVAALAAIGLGFLRWSLIREISFGLADQCCCLDVHS